MKQPEIHDCEHCKSKGRVPCTNPNCDMGWHFETDDIDEEGYACATCKGLGNLPCSECEGRGTELPVEPEYEPDREVA